MSSHPHVTEVKYMILVCNGYSPKRKSKQYLINKVITFCVQYIQRGIYSVRMTFIVPLDVPILFCICLDIYSNNLCKCHNIKT